MALADKLDTLVGFWVIDEKPTGSKDPYALRRAALGVIRLIRDNGLRLGLGGVIAKHQGYFGKEDVTASLLDFFADRLKVALREEGVRHDLIAAVFAVGGEDDLMRLLAKVEALADFLETDDGANLLAAYRRAANIVRIEEKKDGKSFEGDVDTGALAEPEERALAEALAKAQADAARALESEDFAAAMSVLAALRQPVDAFFDTVMVNAEDPALRENRLKLLSGLGATLGRVADFSLIEGGER